MPSWSAPPTFVAGNTLTAAQLNTYVSDNTTHLYDLFNTVQTFTPQLYQAANRTSSTAVGRYYQFGKMVFLVIRMVCSAAGSAGNAIEVRSIPVAAARTGTPNSASTASDIGAGVVVDSGTAAYACSPYFYTTTSLRFMVSDGSTGTDVGANPSFALASNDSISVTMMYEAT